MNTFTNLQETNNRSIKLFLFFLSGILAVSMLINKIDDTTVILLILIGMTLIAKILSKKENLAQIINVFLFVSINFLVSYLLVIPGLLFYFTLGMFWLIIIHLREDYIKSTFTFFQGIVIIILYLLSISGLKIIDVDQLGDLAMIWIIFTPIDVIVKILENNSENKE